MSDMDMHDAAQRMAPRMAERDLQFLRISHDTGCALFGDKADPCPIIVEYDINGHNLHRFRITVRGLAAGIRMETPWVCWGKDTFDPRLKRMRFYADALRGAFKTINETPGTL